MSPPLEIREIRPKDRLLTPAFARILGVQMAFGLSYAAFLLLPKFLRVEFHASATQIGWIAGAAVVAAAVFSPLVGILGARLPKRLVLSVGMGSAVVAALGFAWIGGIGPHVYVLRALQGFSWAAIVTVTATLVADTVPRERLAQAIGYLGLSMLIMNALAPAVAEPIAEHFGWRVVFFGAGCLVLASFFLISGLPAEKHEVVTETRVESQWTPRLLSIHYGSFLMGSGIGVMFTFTQPFALSQGATRVGDFFFGYVAAAVLVRTLFAELADQRGATWVASRALALYACVVALTAWLRPSWMIPLGLGIGVSHGFLYPSLTAAGLGELSAASRTAFMGWFSSVFSLGYALAVLALGPLADRVGFPTIFLVAGFWLATGVLPLAWSHRSRTAARES